jgi:hypothetical protein
MPQITVPDDLYARLLALRPLAEELSEREDG